MPKLVEIKVCDCCPFSYWENEAAICNKTDKELDVGFAISIPIPDWCPLPNAPEGAHCADTLDTKVEKV